MFYQIKNVELKYWLQYNNNFIVCNNCQEMQLFVKALFSNLQAVNKASLAF